jgi:glutathione S-transferase
MPTRAIQHVNNSHQRDLILAIHYTQAVLGGRLAFFTSDNEFPLAAVGLAVGVVENRSCFFNQRGANHHRRTGTETSFERELIQPIHHAVADQSMQRIRGDLNALFEIEISPLIEMHQTRRPRPKRRWRRREFLRAQEDALSSGGGGCRHRFARNPSKVPALLIEKGLDFEEVNAPPTQESDNLARTPMGKMPSIEVDGRFMSESLAIFNYLERLQPEPALLPKDPFASGKTLELACHIKLDVELVARRFLPEVLFKKPVSDETKKQVTADLQKGMAAIERIAVYEPYIAGNEFTIADLYAFYCFGLAGQMAKAVIGVDIMEGQPKLTELLVRLAERPSIARVKAEAAG